MEDPGFFGTRVLSRHGARLVLCRLMSKDSWWKSSKSGVLRRAWSPLPSHQSPTGVTMSLARRLVLLDWASQAGASILKDARWRISL